MCIRFEPGNVQLLTVATALFGGCISGVLHLAAATHLATTLGKYGQPDVHTMHIEFLRYCVARDLQITVADLKCGGTTCTIQLVLSQDGQTKVVALVASTDFGKSLGPSFDIGWSLNPPAKPMPDFAKVEANQEDEHWVPGKVVGDIIPMTGRITNLNARGGFTIPGIADAWNSFDGERMDATHLALMCDFIPSMSDTLLHNGGLYDAHKRLSEMEAWAKEHPGEPCLMEARLADAAHATTINNTISMNIEFKKRLPESGLKWEFTRVQSKRLENGRLDIHVTILDEQMDLVCLSRQAILVLDAKRRFQHKQKPNL